MSELDRRKVGRENQFFRYNFAKNKLAKLLIIYWTTKDHPGPKSHSSWPSGVGSPWNRKSHLISPSVNHSKKKYENAIWGQSDPVFELLIPNMVSKKIIGCTWTIYMTKTWLSQPTQFKKNDICVGKPAEKLGSPCRQGSVGRDYSSSIFWNAVTQSSTHVRNAYIMKSLLAICLTFVLP